MVWRNTLKKITAISFFAAGLSMGSAYPASVQKLYGQFDYPIPGTPSAMSYGKAIPPLGYVEFCGRGQGECRFKGGKNERLILTREIWDAISQVNRAVNAAIEPASDEQQFGKADVWSYPKGKGDCEDFVLQKKRYLIDMGFNADQLLITVVLDENDEGHAVLTAVTNRGDYILDNRRSEVLRWDDTNYKYLKRQSQAQANRWVNLQLSAPQILVSSKTQE